MFNREDYKNELIKRFEYIYENSTFILAPYMVEESFRDDKFKHLGKLPDYLLIEIEKFLLGDDRMEDIYFYKMTEGLKKNKTHLEKVKQGLSLLEDSDEKLDVKKLLDTVRNFIIEETSSLEIKAKKLKALDEYYRIYRYSNDGKVWTSGFDINIRDMKNFDYYSGVLSKSYLVTNVGTSDSVRPGKFVNFLVREGFKNKDNNSVLTEEEKQRIYLKYHDEMPWDYSIRCTSSSDSNVPEDTDCCGKSFYLSEKAMFKNGDNYYMLCPNCGYMVNVPSNILPQSVRQRVDERCALDEDLFRRMTLYSELIQLESKAPKGTRKLIKVDHARKH